MSIVFAQERSLSVEDYVAVLADTAMRDKRPLTNTARIGEMLGGANFIVTAREDGNILGLARCITDFAWVAYCAELAVRESAQGRGIGRAILEKCWSLLGPRIGMVLMAEPTAVDFYERMQMEPWAETYFHRREDRS